MISRAERSWINRFSIWVLLLTTIPYLLGYATTQFLPKGKNYVFGGFVFGIEDGNSYIAKMRSGYEGDWLFRSTYTTYPQNGILANLSYTLLGKLSSPKNTHEQFVALFQLYRIVAGYLCILASYQFLAGFVQTGKFRKLGIMLATLGAGLGWIFVLIGKTNLFGSIPLEFYSPETFGFLEIFGLPHLALARAFLLWSLLVYFQQSLDDPFRIKIMKGLWIGACNLITLLAQPITGVLFWLIVGAYEGFSIVWEITRNYSAWLAIAKASLNRLIPVLIAFLLALPILGILFWQSATDPYFQVWSSQNKITSPHPVHYLIGFGFLLPLVISGIVHLYKTDRRKFGFALCWLILVSGLIYSPIPIQRRLAEGIWVLWVVLGVIALEQISRHRQDWMTRTATGIVLILSIPSTILLWAGGLQTATSLTTPVFLDLHQVKAFNWIDEQAEKPRLVVLAAYPTGNRLPAWANANVLAGLGPESANGSEVEKTIQAFYSVTTTDQARLKTIREFRVAFIFWGPDERKYGFWDPNNAKFLKLKFQSGEYEVFQVVP